MTQKNINLHFIYTTANLGGEKKQYTFVTINPKLLYIELEKLNTPISLYPFAHHIDRERQYSLNINKNPLLYELCQKKFMNNFYYRHEGNFSFESDIDTPSFCTSLLLDANLYQPETTIENFLYDHHILKSYYYEKIKFTIYSKYTEYSRELGTRDFYRTYETTKLTTNDLNGHIKFITDNAIYRSQSKNRIKKIKGMNDNDEEINITLTYKEEDLVDF